ncbi:UNVERIFIED_CONTAM: hypothetical protein K2H54_011251, partial [Gekko kuhli]
KITTTGKKRALLLSSCGVATVHLAQGILAPKKLSETPYEDIIKALTGYFVPKPTKMAKHVDLLVHTQKATVYMDELRQLTINCEFQNMEDIILTQFICDV